MPVLLSVPHSGRDYPDWLIESSAGGRGMLSTLEDPLVDRLAWRAIERGCGAVGAHAPRGMLGCGDEVKCSRNTDDGIRFCWIERVGPVVALDVHAWDFIANSQRSR